MREDLTIVNETMSLTTALSSMNSSSRDMLKNKDTGNSNSPKTVKNQVIHTLLQEKCDEHVFEVVFESIIWILNVIAGYGYLMSILAFYFPNAELYKDQTVGYSLAQSVMLGLSNDNADWWGNFAGDFAWTVEPLLVLMKGFLMSLFLKVKKAGFLHSLTRLHVW